MAAGVLLAVAAGTAPAAAAPKLIGYISYWDQARAVGTLEANPGTFAEVSPSWYAPAPSGRVVLQAKSVHADRRLVALTHRHGAKVIPAVANYRNGAWSAGPVSRVLRDPKRRRRHVGALLRLVAARGYDGIDIDYEHLRAGDRTAFSRFVRVLAARLHARHKLLTVAVHPKDSEPGPQPKNRAQDYAALGRSADELRVMLYDYTWETSAPGPVAPIGWVEDVIRFATRRVPARKLVLGAPLYGYDWPGGGAGESMMWNELASLPGARDAVWDPASASLRFTYARDGRPHTVWFENAESTAAKVSLAVRYGLGGVHFWRLGGEDPSTWAAARAALAG